MSHNSRFRASFWPTAAAFGALWGTIEITLGSFLHTLRLPFTSALLAAIGAALLVAERQVAPARGISMATAVIAALLKSISPGGVILGPMLAITMEGLLVEIALLAAPRFFGAAMLGGFLAALWGVFQKLITQWILYGATILDLYMALLRKAGEWLGHSNAGWWLAAILLGLIALIGAAGGAIGWRIGRDAEKILETEP